MYNTVRRLYCIRHVRFKNIVSDPAYIPRLTATLDGVAAVDLPVWVGFSLGPEEGCEPDGIGDPVELREGGTLADAVAITGRYPAVDALVIMHSDVRVVERGVRTLRSLWDGPIGAWGHASAIVDGVFTHDGVVTPEEYASRVPSWRDAGATMIGGCCGIGPDHLRTIVDSGVLV